MQTKLKKETFQPLLNSMFKITFDDNNAYEVELIEVAEGTPIPSLDIEPFTLMFRAAPTEKIFAQSTYEVFAEETGKLLLFLVPKQPDKEGIYYECIFS